MLIRSQDKTMLTPLSSEFYIIGSEVHCHLTVYGKYSTVEKAIKVLDMICEEYARNQAYIDTGKKLAFVPIKMVFQMPQDEDVEV